MYLACVGVRLPSNKFDEETENERLGRSMMPCEFMNFDKNQLGDDGVENLFGFLMRHRIAVRVLRLESNNITDESVDVICQYLRECDPPVLDLFLSRNQMTGIGLREILNCVVETGKYPQPTHDVEVPRSFFLFATKNRPKSAHALRLKVHQKAAMGEKNLDLIVRQGEPVPYIAEI